MRKLKPNSAKVLYAALKVQEQESEIIQSEIAKAVKLSPAQVCRILQKLEQSGDITHKDGVYSVNENTQITRSVTAQFVLELIEYDKTPINIKEFLSKKSKAFRNLSKGNIDSKIYRLKLRKYIENDEVPGCIIIITKSFHQKLYLILLAEEVKLADLKDYKFSE